jgi:hypothetical protein
VTVDHFLIFYMIWVVVGLSVAITSEPYKPMSRAATFAVCGLIPCYLVFVGGAKVWDWLFIPVEKR